MIKTNSYPNYLQEMPSIPDVGILHCGELPHHKMGIKVGPEIVGVRNYILCVVVKYIQKCGGWDCGKNFDIL